MLVLTKQTLSLTTSTRIEKIRYLKLRPSSIQSQHILNTLRAAYVITDKNVIWFLLLTKSNITASERKVLNMNI
jgi:hypothetical protein